MGKRTFKAPANYYVIGGCDIGSMHISPIRLFKIRVRATKGPGPVTRKPDGTFVLRKGEWADQYDALAQIYVARALAQFWRGNVAATPGRVLTYVRQYVEAVTRPLSSVAGVRPRLDHGLKKAPEEIADLLRKRAAIEVLSKPGLPFGRQAQA